MHRNTLRLTPLGLSLAIATALSGCANLPTHDGSLRTVYGMDQQTSERYARVEDNTTPITSGRADEEQSAITDSGMPVDPDTPVVRTLTNGASIVSQPITRSETPDFNTDASDDSVAEIADTELAAMAVREEPVTTPVEIGEVTTQTASPTQAKAPPVVAEVLPVTEERVTRHVVSNADTLSSIARQYTGNRNNWKRIAEFNGLAKPYSIRVGDELLIPDNTAAGTQTQQATASNPTRIPLRVVPPTRKSEPQAPVASTPIVSATAEPAQTVTDTTTSGTSPLPELVQTPAPTGTAAPAPTHTESVVAKATVPAATAGAVVAGEAAEETQVGGLRQRFSKLTTFVKSGFRKTDADTDSAEEATMTVDAGAETAPVRSGKPTVRVTGNFTPKAVYKAPDYASGLLMRVAPGSTFETSGQEGEWVSITTDQGAGYILHRDVQAVE